VLERVQVEVRAQLGVQHGQHVLVEGSGDPGRVVVRREQDRGVLDQVGAQQQAVALAQRRADPGQERGPLARQQVADRAAQERNQPPALSARRSAP